MKKTLMAIITISGLIAVSFSTFALSRMQAAESVKIQNEKDATDISAQSADSGDPQILRSDVQQASTSDVMENSGEVDDSCPTQDEQMSNKNDFALWTTETDQNQISELPIPLPDGRVFLQASAGSEDPIPYIPTESPKTSSGTPIVPPELEI